MSFLEKNLQTLKESGCGAETLLKDRVELTPLVSGSGSVTATRDGVYLHSKFSPEKEAARLIEALPKSQAPLIIFGFGLAYHIEAFFAANPQGRAIVIEPEPAFLHAALLLRDYTNLFRQKNLKLLIGVEPEHIAGRLPETEDEEFQVLRLRSVYSQNEEYYRRVDQTLSRLASRRDININTLKRFGRLWVRNLARNIPRIAASPGVNRLTGILAGFPFLVLAAGPSLDAILPHLPSLAEKCVTVAVDTSYAACLRAGVQPDFIVVVDPQYWNTRHLDRVEENSTILISESSTHPRIFRLLPHRTYLGGSLFPLGRYLEEAADSKGKLGAGGSVATSAWDFARLAGGAPIIMAGLDLGFPQKNTHCKGSFFEDRTYHIASRLAPSETQSCRYLYDAAPRLVPSMNGGQVLSDMRMLIYIWWFEIQAKRWPAVQTLNLSPGGAKIEGHTLTDTGSLLALPPRRKEIDHILTTLEENAPAPVSAERFKGALSRLFCELSRLEKLCTDGLRITASLRKNPAARSQLAELDRIDKHIQNLENKDIAGFLLAGALKEIAESQSPGMDAALDNSEKLYTALRESAEYHRSLLQNAAEENFTD
ncbi:MAG: DUF115 domain-containing protein [Spirochaetales bacterium]|jgi:hypothetical protein|nr:DUF115 domain-containing protein [Spirochaetales bacterium]